MSFVSYSFAILLGIVLTVRVLTNRRSARQPYLGVLIVASIVFYGWHVPWYLVLILASTAVDFVAGGRIAATDEPRARRLWLVTSLAFNLGLLGFFKYANFLAGEANRMLGFLALTGSEIPHLDLVLPIGISFYTFQSMSYTIDVYRGRLAPATGFWRFFLFVSFFPQLVAGPIVRAREFLYQIPRRRPIRATVWGEGAFLIVRGFFLKMVVADNLGAAVDLHWSSGYEPGSNALLSVTMVLFFSGQIFADFAGYSSIARGVAYLLGFRLPVNFNSPYIAASFSEFWRRWHITLSRWLRDYLYIPLGGNRKGPIRTYVNLALVMLLGGLWHGAANTFIIWGTLHGTGLAVERALSLNRADRSAALRTGWAVAVQGLVLVAWVFFRSESVGSASQFLLNIGTGGLGALPEGVALGFLFLIPLAAMHARTWACERSRLPRLGAVEKGFWAALMLYFTITAHARTQTFIYFQF